MTDFAPLEKFDVNRPQLISDVQLELKYTQYVYDSKSKLFGLSIISNSCNFKGHFRKNVRLRNSSACLNGMFCFSKVRCKSFY